MPSQPLRLFIAIELTPEVHLALAQLQDTLKRHLPPKIIRWTKADGIHLTLKFLGDTPHDTVPAVVQGMTAAAAGFAPFEFHVAGFGCFPNPRKARVLWVGLPDPPKAMAGLQRAVDLHMHKLGYSREERAFSPHLTLGRVNDSASPVERQTLSDLLSKTQAGLLGSVPAYEIILFKSDLLPGGAIYTALARVPLGATAP